MFRLDLPASEPLATLEDNLLLFFTGDGGAVGSVRGDFCGSGYEEAKKEYGEEMMANLHFTKQAWSRIAAMRW